MAPRPARAARAITGTSPARDTRSGVIERRVRLPGIMRQSHLTGVLSSSATEASQLVPPQRAPFMITLPRSHQLRRGLRLRLGPMAAPKGGPTHLPTTASQLRLLAAYSLRCFRATRRASRLRCPSWAISTRAARKQIHITVTPGAHVIVPAIARPPKVSKTPARPSATTESLIAFWRSIATSLPGTPLGKRSSFPSRACIRNPIPMNPMPAPANRPPALMLHPPVSEIAKYPCETTMATPPPVRSAELTTQNLICIPEPPR